MTEVSGAREDLMGRNEYARHRRCAPNAVKKAEDDGRIAGAVIREADGTFVGIDWRLADKLWAQNTDPGEAAKNGKVNIAPASALNNPHREAAAEAGAPENEGRPPTAERAGDLLETRGEDGAEASPAEAVQAGKAGEDPHGYLAARAERERYGAERARIDLLERLGLLTSTAEVRDETFTVFRQLRDNLVLIGPRISQRLAAETDPLRIEQLINEQHRTVLNELSRALASDAAGGVGERAHAVS